MPNLLEIGNTLFNPAFRTRVMGAVFVVLPKLMAKPDLTDEQRLFLSSATKAAVHLAETILPKVLSYPGVTEKLIGDPAGLDDKLLEAVEAVLLDFQDLKLE